MSTLKAAPAQESRIEEIQQQLGEREDRLHSEQIRDWILQLAADREAKASRRNGGKREEVRGKK